MAVVRQYGLPEQEARGVQNPYPQVPAAGDLATFGGNTARDLQQAGANLERTADTTFGIFERVAKEANDLKVDSDMNKFVVEKQKTLVDFAQLKGEDAIKGAGAATESLLNSKKLMMEGAANDYQRNVLSRRLDAHMLDASGSITQHVAKEAQAARVQTNISTLNNLNNQAVIDQDNAKAFETGLGIVRDVAANTARIAHGQSASPEIIKDIVDTAQSKYVTGVLESKIAGNKPDAPAFYNQYKDKILAKDRPPLEKAITTLQSSLTAQEFVRSPAGGSGAPSAEAMKKRVADGISFFEQDGYGRHVGAGIVANFLHESGFRTDNPNPKDGADGSDSIGIAHWNAERAVALKKFVAENGGNFHDVNTQLKFVKAEIDANPALKAKLQNARTASEAAEIFTREFERPKNPELRAAERANTAEKILVESAPAPVDSRVGDPLAAQVNATTAGRVPPTLESSVNAATAPAAQQVIDAAQGVPDVRQKLIELGDWRQKKLAENQAKYGNNPDQLAKNQAAVSTSFEQQKQAIELQKNQVWDAIWSSIKANPKQMPNPNLMSQIDPREQESIQKMVDRNIEGAKTKTNWGVYSELRTALLDPNPDVSGPVSKLNPMQFRPVMADDEFKEITKLQEAIRKGDPEGHVTHAQTFGKMITERLGTMNIKTGEKASNTDKANELRFTEAAQDSLRELEKSKGNKRATPEEMSKILRDLTYEVSGTGGWFDFGKKRAYEVPNADPSKFVVKIENIPKSDLDKITQALTAEGIKPTDDEVIKRYRIVRLGVKP